MYWFHEISTPSGNVGLVYTAEGHPKPVDPAVVKAEEEKEEIITTTCLSSVHFSNV